MSVRTAHTRTLAAARAPARTTAEKCAHSISERQFRVAATDSAMSDRRAPNPSIQERGSPLRHGSQVIALHPDLVVPVVGEMKLWTTPKVHRSIGPSLTSSQHTVRSCPRGTVYPGDDP